MPSTANQEGIQKARPMHYPSNADYCQSRGNSEGTACAVRLMPPTASQGGIQKARHMCCLSDAKQKEFRRHDMRVITLVPVKQEAFRHQQVVIWCQVL